MKHSIFPRTARLCLSAAAIALLAGCANMADTPPGTSLSQVESKYGAPTYSCTDDHGAQRLVWSQQPMGQYAWGTRVDQAGHTDRIEPLLTDQHFQLLAKGSWTPDQVRCEFGPPAQIERVGLPSSSQIVWSYRYRQSGAWNSLMYVYFGADGSRVTRFHPGPDPMYDRDNFWMF
jgi:hypothetical protein